MSLERLTDASVLKFYENIRQQVVADSKLGSPHRLLGDSARHHAIRLEQELVRRRLRFTPIVWR